MRNSKGAALFQYIIIIALVVLMLVPILILFGEQLKNSFMSLLNSQTQLNTQLDKNIRLNSNNLQGGDLNGTPTAPVEKCTSGQCTIDFGSYIIKGIPENTINDFNSMGASGIDKQIADVFQQLATQLEAENNTTEANYFKNISNIIHYTADMQQNIESISKQCQSNGNDLGCLYMEASVLSEKTLPANISGLLPGMPGGQDPNYNNYGGYGYINAIDHSTTIGQAQYDYLNNQSNFNNYKDQYASYALVDQYNLALNSNNIPQELKNISTSLLQYVSEKNQEFMARTVSIAATSGGGYDYEKFDFATGTSKGTVNFTGTYDQLLAPQTSLNNNLRSALICASGKNTASLNSCY